MMFPRKRDIYSYALVLYICHCLICKSYTSLFTRGHIAGSPYIDPNYEAELLAEILVTSQNSTANVSDGAHVLDIIDVDLVDEFDRSQEANKSRTYVVIGAVLAAVLVVSLLAMSATIIIIYTKR